MVHERRHPFEFLGDRRSFVSVYTFGQLNIHMDRQILIDGVSSRNLHFCCGMLSRQFDRGDRLQQELIYDADRSRRQFQDKSVCGAVLVLGTFP